MNLKAVYLISYGLYVTGSMKEERLNGQTASAVIQVSSEPPNISVCINKGNFAHDFVKDSGIFTVSVLSQDTPFSFFRRFGFKSGRETDAYCHQVKRGTTPRTAPSYIGEKKEVAKMSKYRCSVCGYVYNPELGDPESNVPPGTPFEELPEDWLCLVCEAIKDEFEKEETS